MVKRLLLVSLLASACFGDVVTINFNTTDQNIWDHKNATLYNVDVQAELDNALGGSSYKIESAVLKFTGIQNLREPESDDALHLGMVQVSGYNGYTKISETQGYKYYTDGEDNSNVSNKGNFFENNSAHTSFTWVEGSDLGFYTDNNDNNSYLLTDTTIAGLVDYSDGKPNNKYYYGGNPSGLHLVNGKWTYLDGSQHLWHSLQNYTTEDFDKVLDVALLQELMGNSDGRLGFTFDADCHYMGNVALEITTSPTNVPEPASMSFLLVGLASLGGVCFSRKRK